MNADGSGQANFTNDPADDLHPSFSPDGTRIALDTNRNGNEEIYSMSIGGTARLTNQLAIDIEPDWGVAFPQAPSPPPTDTDPPETAITKGAPKKSESGKATFQFSSDEVSSTFQCKLKGKDLKPAVTHFRPCATPKKYKKLDPGNYKFFVVARDAANNVDPTPATDKFKVVG